MSISNYINDVRSRSEEAKQRAVFLWSSFFIVVIFLVWVVTFSLSVSNNNAEEARLRAEAEKLAMAKVEALASSTPNTANEKESVKGLIPQIFQLLSDGVDSVSSGFWLVGDMLHK